MRTEPLHLRMYPLADGSSGRLQARKDMCWMRPSTMYRLRKMRKWSRWSWLTNSLRAVSVLQKWTQNIRRTSWRALYLSCMRIRTKTRNWPKRMNLWEKSRKSQKAFTRRTVCSTEDILWKKRLPRKALSWMRTPITLRSARTERL